MHVSATPAVPSKLFLTVKETAQLIGVSARLVYLMLSRGQIRSKRFGGRILVPREEFLRLAEIQEKGVTCGA
jgi:excisionase family DNA binding protein